VQVKDTEPGNIMCRCFGRALYVQSNRTSMKMASTVFLLELWQVCSAGMTRWSKFKSALQVARDRDAEGPKYLP
jgi:hypothetical protein